MSVEKLKKSSIYGAEIAMTNLSFMGAAFATDAEYCSHVPNNCFYDPVIDKIVLFHNDQDSHVGGVGVLRHRTFDPKTLIPSEHTLVYSASNRKIGTTSAIRMLNGDWFVIARQTNGMTVEKYICLKSTDQGANWTNWDLLVSPSVGTYQDQCAGLYQLSSGRLICGLGIQGYHTYVMRSDDMGVTWTSTIAEIPRHASYTGATPHEPRFIELPNKRIMAMLRASMNANLYANVEPVLYSFSDDQGLTWSRQVASLTLTDCTANYPPAVIEHKSEGYLELIWGSRYIWGSEGHGRIYQSMATYEDAEKDNWQTPVILGHYAAEVNLSAYDCGYHGACIDTYGGVHSFFYDLKTNEAGKTNLKYMYGIKGTNSVAQTVKDIEKYYVKKPTHIDVIGNKTLTANDMWSVQDCKATAVITVPLHTTAPIPIYTEIPFSRLTDGEVSFVSESAGVLLRNENSYFRLSHKYSTCVLIKIGENEWLLVGSMKE